MKRLNELINCSYDIKVSGVKSDSRKIKPGDLFVAIKGFFNDHYDFIDDAIKNGAVAVVADREVSADIISVVVEDVNLKYYEILRKFYDDIDKEFTLIGITGTDGKTTTTTIISRILEDCCYIGTNGAKYKDISFDIENTTPDISVIYYIMKCLHVENCQKMSMEVSSEALFHDRIKGLQYDIVGFTNITEDHLNIHGTLDNYIDSKKKIVDMLKSDGVAIFNIDDKNIEKIVKKCKSKYYTYGFKKNADFRICKVDSNSDGVNFEIKFGDNIYTLESSLFGIYNIYNITLAFIVSYVMGDDVSQIINKIKSIGVIDGRLEKLDFGQDFKIILDYAHTENGIRSLLSNIRNIYKDGRLIVVSGSAGGREKEKRRGMGRAIFEYCDYAIFTMDDPRYEDVDSIIDDLIGDYKGNNYERIIDRLSAIKRAVDIANSNDILVIMGKGRDNYMAILDKKIPYSDYEVLKDIFSNK